MGRNIGKSATAKVSELGVVLLRLVGDVVRQVVLHGFLLEPGSLEVVAETTGTGVPGNFGCVRHGASYGGHVGTGGGEDGIELGAVSAVGGATAGSNSCAAVSKYAFADDGGEEYTFVTG